MTRREFENYIAKHSAYGGGVYFFRAPSVNAYGHIVINLSSDANQINIIINPDKDNSEWEHYRNIAEMLDRCKFNSVLFSDAVLPGIEIEQSFA